MCSFETIRNSVGSSSARVAACPNLGCDDPNMGCLSVAGPKAAGPSSREGHVNLLAVTISTRAVIFCRHIAMAKLMRAGMVNTC